MTDNETVKKNQINKLVESVQNVEKEIEKSFAAIANECHSPDERTLLLLLGPTGSGKTTLSYALNDQDLYGFQYNSRARRLEARNKKANFEIGHTGTAKTFIPGFQYNDKSGIIFCDCPGFFDNRGEIQDISNSFAISNVLSRAKNVKILLLVSCSDLLSAKGKAFRESCEIVEKLIPDQNDFQPIIGLVITHVESSLCTDDISFLENVDCGNGWLLNYFQNSEKGPDRIVFKFPSPTRAMMGNTYTGFNDKEVIIKFIQKKHTIQITPYIVLSTNAKLMILSGIDSFGCILTLLQHFVDQIRIDSSQSSADLEQWKNRIYQLSRLVFENPGDFVQKAQNIIPMSNLYQNLYDQFLRIQAWRLFLERIALEGVKVNDEIITKNSQLMSPVFLDITKTLSQMLAPVISILNTKIELREIEKKNVKADEEVVKINEINQKIKDQIKEEQVRATQKQEDLNKELEKKKQDLISAQKDLEQAKRELEAASRRGGGGLFGSICRLAAGIFTASLFI